MNFADPFAITIFAVTALALLGLPIGHAMIAASILYLWMSGLDMGTAAEQILNGMYSNYIILAVPLFILAAELMNIGSMTDRLLVFCNAFVGRFRGGLAQVNVLQSIIFAGMSGSAIADAAGSGKIMQRLMTADGKYPASYAAALTAATAVIGPIIPPSIPMIIYALISNASIGYLFLGGVVPGLLMAALQMVLVAFDARRKGFPVEPPTPLRELPRITLAQRSDGPRTLVQQMRAAAAGADPAQMDIHEDGVRPVVMTLTDTVISGTALLSDAIADAYFQHSSRSRTGAAGY